MFFYTLASFLGHKNACWLRIANRNWNHRHYNGRNADMNLDSQQERHFCGLKDWIISRQVDRDESNMVFLWIQLHLSRPASSGLMATIATLLFSVAPLTTGTLYIQFRTNVWNTYEILRDIYWHKYCELYCTLFLFQRIFEQYFVISFHDLFSDGISG